MTRGARYTWSVQRLTTSNERFRVSLPVQVGSRIYLFGDQHILLVDYIRGLTTKVEDLPSGLSISHAILVDDYMILFLQSGRRMITLKFDLASNTLALLHASHFSQIPPSCIADKNIAGFIDPLKIIVLYGAFVKSSQNALYTFDPVTSIFLTPRTSGKQPNAIYGAASCTVGRKIYVFGGRTRQRDPFSDEFSILFCHKSESLFSWSQVRPVGASPSSRFGTSLTRAGEQLVLYGGSREAVVEFESLCMFNLVDDTWQVIGEAEQREEANLEGVDRHWHWLSSVCVHDKGILYFQRVDNALWLNI